MVLISWHAAILVLSAGAAVLGLFTSSSRFKPMSSPTTADFTQNSLIQMVFLYWLLYCLSEGLESITSTDWFTFGVILRLIAMVSYVLTFCCLVSLPLHHLEIHQHHGPSES